MTDGTELVTLPKSDALAVFTAPEKIEPILARIRKEIDSFTPDLSTATSRKAIASMAYKVAQSKSYLDGVGKDLVDEQKKIPNLIDGTRKKIRDTLDKWRDEVRKPLTDWETADESRVELHKANIDELAACAADQTERPSLVVRNRLAEAIEAAAKVKADAEAAAQREAAEKARREADREHRCKIHRAAMTAFIDIGLSEDIAKQVVTLIAAGNIPSVTISY